MIFTPEISILLPRLIEVNLWRWTWGGIVWSMTSTCRQNGAGFTTTYPYEVAAGRGVAGEVLRGVTGSRRILVATVATRGGKAISLGSRSRVSLSARVRRGLTLVATKRYVALLSYRHDLSHRYLR